MRNYTYMIAQFSFYDRTGIRKMLEEKAEKGWMLDKIGNFFWRFRRTEPKKLQYAVTYFPKASAYDPGPSERQKDLLEFCAHSGWVLAGTSAQLQVFYNEGENPVPIETDPQIELENIHRSAKKNYLPVYIMLLVLAVFQIAMQIGQLMTFPLTYLSQDTVAFNWLIEIVLFVMCAIELVGYYRWYRRARLAAENGEFIETKGHRSQQLILLGIVMAALVWQLCSMNPAMASSMAVILILLFLVIFLVNGTQSIMKKKGVSTDVNRAVTFALAVVLSIAVTALAIPVAGNILELPVWEKHREVRQYEWNGVIFDIYRDEIPLQVEDLAEVISEDYSYEAREQSSILLGKGEYSQQIWGSSDLPEMNYTVYTTPIPGIYDLCLREAIQPADYPIGVDEAGNMYYESYEPQDPAPWGAEAVYRRYAGGEPYLHRYILCYQNKVVILEPNWELTRQQMAVAGEKLGE